MKSRPLWFGFADPTGDGVWLDGGRSGTASRQDRLLIRRDEAPFPGPHKPTRSGPRSRTREAWIHGTQEELESARLREAGTRNSDSFWNWKSRALSPA